MIKKYCTCLVLIFLALSVYSNVLNTTISLSVSKMPLCNVLKLIEKKAEVSFAYKGSTLNKNRPITLSVNSMTLDNVLKIILFEDNVKFSVLNSHIIIYKKNELPPFSKDALWLEPLRDTIITEVYDTTYITDTSFLEVTDTIFIYDTIVTKKKRLKKKKTTRFESFYSEVNNYTGIRKIQYSDYLNDYFHQKKGSILINTSSVLFGLKNNSVSLHSGIGYSLEQSFISYSIYEYYKNIVHDSVSYTLTSVNRKYIALPGIDTAWILDTLVKDTSERTVYIYESVDTKNEELKTRAHYLLVPINFSVQIKTGNKFSFLVSAQMNTQFLMNVSSTKVIYRYENVEKELFFNPAKVKVYTSLLLGAQYQINKQLYLKAQTSFSYHTSSVFTQKNFTSKNTLQYGLNLGIGFAY